MPARIRHSPPTAPPSPLPVIWSVRTRSTRRPRHRSTCYRSTDRTRHARSRPASSSAGIPRNRSPFDKPVLSNVEGREQALFRSRLRPDLLPPPPHHPPHPPPSLLPL